MSFKTNDYQQLSITDSFNALSTRVQNRVLGSWAKTFAEIVFPAIDEQRFSVLYSDKKFSRPNTPINIVIGALMLKELLCLTDDELFDSICCDVRFQFALHTTTYDEQPVSDRTFSRFRERLYHYEIETGEDLLKEEMQNLSETFAKYLNLNSSLKRMDSLMVASSCKKMSRLEIIYTVTENAVKLLDRLGATELIPSELNHYRHPDDRNKVIYYTRNEDITDRLEKVIYEAGTLLEAMSDDAWIDFSEYQLLSRVLREQADSHGDGNYTPKKKQDISSGNLLNPSDPEATYRTKGLKGYRGYTGNIIETVGEDGCSLISDIGYENNRHSDSEFCREYLATKNPSDSEEILIADGGYSATQNSKMAKSKNVELITTALTGNAPDTIKADFVLNDKGTEILTCPAGNQPIRCSYQKETDTCRATYAKETCMKCSNCEKCKVFFQATTAVVRVSAKTIERAKHLKKLSTTEYKELARKRNAIEGIPSVLRRKYRVDEMPVRGLVRTKMLFTLKVCAYNVKKLIRYMPKQQVESALNPPVG